MTNPYESVPDHYPPNAMLPGPMGAPRKPQVCLWYNVYCACFVVLYVVCSVLGLLLAIFAQQIADASQDKDVMGNVVVGIVMMVFSIPLTGLFIVGLLVPRKKWGWIYGFFPIAIGLTSPCCMLASLPLLIFWLKADTRRWFNVE